MMFTCSQWNLHGENKGHLYKHHPIVQEQENINFVQTTLNSKARYPSIVNQLLVLTHRMEGRKRGRGKDGCLLIVSCDMFKVPGTPVDTM